MHPNLNLCHGTIQEKHHSCCAIFSQAGIFNVKEPFDLVPLTSCDCIRKDRGFITPIKYRV